MTLEMQPLAEITQDAFRILNKEIGIANTVRFITQFTKGYGNYTQERQELFDKLSLDDVIAEIKRDRKAP
ncbi:MAG: hypothetical protein ACOYYS_16975 [Chloroflexota bacterium]